MDANTIRQLFLDYFARHGHQIVRSSSLVPANDPTLYFTNAGMVQFKDVFTGQERRGYKTATSTQKCLRVSGKHNDLENVGRTARHHTFFEMLGNFSFGDYFKAEAIAHAWEFLTGELELDPQRFVATIFEGEGEVPADEEAFDAWHRDIGLSADRVLRLGKADNFWSMGETGPCGPCSELHYLQSEDLPCPEQRCLGVACECDRWVEVWNLVFMQFNRDASGQLTPLAATGVDTGMGLERLVAVKQGKTTTYETDLVLPHILLTAELAGLRYGDDAEQDVSLRVVADHARATAFCIADGVFPEKGGREYVLRRIMRRAIRHGKLLGFEEPFFYKICASVVQAMGQAFPELQEAASVIDKLAMAEETSFRRTLGRGLLKVQQEVQRATAAGQRELSDAFVGDLYATEGFPIDLTRLMAQEHGLAVDEAAAHAWVLATHGASDTRIGEEAVAAVYKELLDRHGATEFVGYDHEQLDAEVLALVRVGAEVERAAAGQVVEVVTNKTPFYGRSGGQLGDRGVIRWQGGEARVTDTLKPGGKLIVHQAEVLSGELIAGQVTLEVDPARRQAIRLNHSATHLLHHALRQILGDHVAQKGSEVSPDALRFDFSHFEGLTADQVRQVEAHVNDEIRRDAASRTELMDQQQAREAGAMALFGEKYDELVRVVHIGGQSRELCGGTHVQRAGEIGLFKVLSEEALAMGVRRITAATGAGALDRVQQTEAALRSAAALLRCGPDQLGDRIDKLQEQARAQERELQQLKRKVATGGGTTDLKDKVREHNGIKVLATRVDAADPKTLRDAGDTLRNWLGSGVVVLGGVHKEKATVLVMVSKDLTKQIKAGDLMRQLAQVLGGKGGGRPDMAQGGGPKIELLDQALEKVFELL